MPARNSLAHLALFLGALLVWFAGLLLIQFVVVRSVTPDVVYSEAEYQRALSTARGAGLVAGLGWSYGTLGLIAPRVGYRKIDFLMVLIPLYGLLVFTPKLLWRWTWLPRADWESSPQPTRSPVEERRLDTPAGLGTRPDSPSIERVEPRAPPQPKHRGALLTVLLGGAGLLLLVALLAVVAYQVNRNKSTPDTAQPTVQLSPPPPKPSPTHTQTPRRVEGAFPHEARGTRLTLDVFMLGVTGRCREGQFRPGNKYLTAYFFDCSDVAGSQYDPYLLYVSLTNHTNRAIRITLRNFVIVARDGDSQAPVNVRNDADKPEAFIASTALVLPRASSKGWVAFDGQLAFVPSQLSYVDTGQVLTVEFEGKHRV